MKQITNQTPLVIGITGGVGSGKSTICSILSEEYHAHIIIADLVAHRLMEPGGSSYFAICHLLGDDILVDPLDPLSPIDHKKMAAKIFANESLLNKINEITHPLVIEAISQEIEQCKQRADLSYIVVEAALLTKGALDVWCDTIWYIYVPEQIRIARLMESRHYTEEKCRSIMNSQPSEEAFRAFCDFELDNSKPLDAIHEAIKNRLNKR